MRRQRCSAWRSTVCLPLCCARARRRNHHTKLLGPPHHAVRDGGVDENKVAIAAAGAIKPLIMLLRSPMRDVRMGAAGTLAVLAGNGARPLLVMVISFAMPQRMYIRCCHTR